jgi:hypothetical protein
LCPLVDSLHFRSHIVNHTLSPAQGMDLLFLPIVYEPSYSMFPKSHQYFNPWNFNHKFWYQLYQPQWLNQFIHLTSM